MVANSVSVAVALVLCTSSFGAAPAAASGTARALAPAAVSTTEVAAGLWAPKKAKPKPRPSEDDSAKEEELLRSRNSPRAPVSRSRNRIKMESSGESASEESDEASEEEEQEEEEEDRPKRKRKRVVEEEEEEEDEEDVPLPSLPVIRPRLVFAFVGGGAANRSFKYDSPLQGDSGFRPGYSIALEAYPLLRAPPGLYRRFGMGFVYEKQSGTAGDYDMATGSTVSYPISQSHWGIDVRFFFPIGPRVVLTPAAGYGRLSADLQRLTPMRPSLCSPDNAGANFCFADLNASFASLDLHLRIAATSELAFSLGGGYLFGLGVKTGEDQISTAEASATMRGFHVEVGASYLIKDWFAVQATIPIRRYAYKLSPLNTTATYRGASDLYWGVIVGVAFLAP